MSIAQFLVFDLDDTLLDTSDVYYLARKRFLDIMTEAGFEESKTLEVFEEIDAELIRVMKHSPARYGESMKLTYGKLAKSDGKSLSNDTLSRIEACGEMVPNGIPNIIDGARNLLDWSVRNYTVGLFTRGENWLQSRKVEASGLAKYFTHFEVVKEKNADVLGKFIKKSGFDPSNTWIIGDSIKSDINPGIQIGAHCILFAYAHPHYIWLQEYDTKPIGNSFHRIENLEEAIPIISSRK